VIEITFSEGQYRLFLEFFAAGNIILTDAGLNVLALLRQVSEGDEDVDVRLGGKYTLEAKQNFHGIPPVTRDRVRDALLEAQERTRAANEVGGKKAKRAKGGNDLKKALNARFPEYPVHLLEHVFNQAGLDTSAKVEDVLDKDEMMSKVIEALGAAGGVLKSLDSPQTKGYIIAKVKDAAKAGPVTQTPSRDALLYDDFHPFRPSQFENKRDIYILEFDGFNRAVDEFYSSIESQRLESRLTEREEAAKRKLQTAKDEHEKRLGALQQAQEIHIRKAQAIEANTHRVEEACAAVNGLVGQGMDWVDIGKLIENEQHRGNVVAQMIKLPLKLEENTVTLLLDEPGAEEEDEDGNSEAEDRTDDEVESEDAEAAPVTGSRPTGPSRDTRLAIDIDLALSPWANARQYYEQKKSAAVKEQKTIQASTRALKSTEKKIEADLKKGLKQEKAGLRPARKQFWFEKFWYFVSSDGYLVIGGKDAQQNELLYRRHLKKGDVYVHADLQGASSVIVKNNPQTPDAPIPPSTLSQAGALTVCTSSAWDSKAVMAAWWVNADQVSKTAPTGEYLTIGGFVVRGKKNFLPPSQLLLGFGVMWLISEESRVNHGKHRLARTESVTGSETEALVNDAQDLSIEDEKGENSAADGGKSGPVPGVEDAGQDAETKVHKDIDVLDKFEDDSEEEEDDRASTSSSDAEVQRSNPLQTNGATEQNKADTPEVEVQSEPDSDRDSDQVNDDGRRLAEDSSRPSTPASFIQTAAQSKTPPASKSKQLVRGKRGKAKKAAKKYAEQDEEDRALAMLLLGSNKTTERKEKTEAEKKAREEKAQADRERRRAQHARAAEAERLRQERLERGGDVGEEGDGDAEVDTEQMEQERKEHMNIDLLVPVAEPGDELIAALPVCAPWGALGRCKYKVKLQPGNVKKGKAIKEIVGWWTALGARGSKVVDESNRDKERVWARELELLKAWRVEEIVGVLPVKGVRIVQGGGFGGGVGGGGGGAGGGSGGRKGAGRGGGSGTTGKGSKKVR